jgi:hypothetical protein
MSELFEAQGEAHKAAEEQVPALPAVQSQEDRLLERVRMWAITGAEIVTAILMLATLALAVIGLGGG